MIVVEDDVRYELGPDGCGKLVVVLIVVVVGMVVVVVVVATGVVVVVVVGANVVAAFVSKDGVVESAAEINKKKEDN